MNTSSTGWLLIGTVLVFLGSVPGVSANGVIEIVTFEQTDLGEIPNGWSTPLYPTDSRWTPAFVTDVEAFSGTKSLALNGDKYSDMYKEWVWPKSGTYVFQAWFYPTIQTPSSPNPRLMFGATNSFDFSLRTNDTFISSPGPDMGGPPVEWSSNEWILLRVVIDFDLNLADFYVGRSGEDLELPVISGYSFDPAWFEVIATGSGYNWNTNVYVDDVLFREGLDSDGDGVLDGADPQPLNPFVCGLDDDGDTCDDCTTGVDGFGPLPDNDFTNDGPDGDGDGICDAGDELWFSVLQLQWGFPTLYPQNVYKDPPLGGPAELAVPAFLPNPINLDALDLMVLGGDFLFSVDRSGTIATPSGPVAMNESDIFRYSGGVITTELSWVAESVPVRGLNALDHLGPDLFAFSVNRQQIVRDGLGVSRYIKPWQVFTYDRATGAIALLFDAAPFGFNDVDGVDMLADGRLAISNNGNSFVVIGGVPTFVRGQNAYIVDPPNLILAYDGGASGLATLDAITMIVPEAP